MGHAYEKIVSDVYARWYRLMGRDVYFLTGTDENGQKLVKAAESEKQPVRQFIDSQVDHFKQLCQRLEITNNDFIRTTEERHKVACQSWWKKLESQGDIYFGNYEGLYCLACETFYLESQVQGMVCPVHGTALDIVKEKGFFFKLSAYSDVVKKHIEDHPDVLCPPSVRKEMLNRIAKEPIRDLSISRPNSGWGIPVPGHEDYVMYTWFDALINYVSALDHSPEKTRYWPASMHVIGKDIVWFHTVIWFSMLKAMNLPFPKQIYVHGMVLGEDGKKMSKSLGNGVDPRWILDRFPVDSFRYYILRAIASGLDGAFVRQDLLSRHNNELANDYGNLLMRVTKLTLKKKGAHHSTEGISQELNTEKVLKAMVKSMDDREHHRALDTLWDFVGEINNYLNQKAPWKLDAQGAEFATTVVNAFYGLRVLGILIEPFLPRTGALTQKYLGERIELANAIQFKGQVFTLSEPEVLFPKLESTSLN